MKSDKMQMSYVPQTSEHIKITSVKNGTDVYDIKLPIGAIIEDIVVVKKTLFGVANADVNLGNTTTANDYTATAIDAGSGGSLGVVGVDNGDRMTPVPADQIVRVSVTGTAANTAGVVYVWVNYRFDSNPYPTQLV